MLTQWRTGMGGPEGLDYAVLPFVAKAVGLTNKQLRTAFDDLQSLEREALRWVAEQNKG